MFTFDPQVTFDLNGGDGTAPPAQTVPWRTPADKPTNPVRKGRVFNGWYEGDRLHNFATPVTADTTLTAHWGTLAVAKPAGQAGHPGKTDGPDTGGTTLTLTPTAQDGTTGVGPFTQVSTTAWHTVALDSNGHIWAWGCNNRLGGNDATDQHTPIEIKPDMTFSQVRTGDSHTVAIDSSGHLWAWGWNYYGQLGDGTTTTRHTPVRTHMLGIAVTAASFGNTDGTAAGTITATDPATGAVTLTTPKHKAGLTDIPVDYTFDGDPQTTVTLAGAFTYYPTTKTLPLTGGTWGLPAVSAGLALSLLLCASALTAYRHRRYSK